LGVDRSSQAIRPAGEFWLRQNAGGSEIVALRDRLQLICGNPTGRDPSKPFTPGAAGRRSVDLLNKTPRIKHSM
jgi:hypothetical protein